MTVCWKGEHVESMDRVQWVPEILHALSQPLQQELDVLCNVLVVVLLLLKVLQLLQHLALNHGQSILLPGLPLCRLLQEILSRGWGMVINCA